MKKIVSRSRFLLTLALAVSVFAGCGNKHTISGNIKGLGDDSILISVNTADFGGEQDKRTGNYTVPAQNGRFTFDIELKTPALVVIIPKSLQEKSIDGSEYALNTRIISSMMLRPGEKVNIKASLNNKVLDYEIKGTEYNSDLSKLRKQELPYLVKSDSIRFLIKSQTEGHDELFEQSEEIFEERRLLYYKYISDNPDAELSAFLTMSLPYDSTKVYYDKLGDKAKNGVFKDLLQKQLARSEEYAKMKKAEESIAPGFDAPVFTLKTPDGGSLSLTDIQGKYIVLDFWGSWCGWCIYGFPKMKEYYAKYSGKVEFIGIDCMEKEEKWLDALKEHDLPWKHVIDNPEDKVSVKYAVQGYPKKS